MQRSVRWALGTWAGRIVAVLLLLVLGLGVLFASGKSATSVHISVATSGCQLCTEPAGEVRFDKTFTDSGFVHSLQDAMNTAPWAGPMTCGQDNYVYTFDFLTVGGVVVQSYSGSGNCYDSKSTLGVPPTGPFDLMDPSPGILLFDVTYHGQGLFDALHQEIGLP